MVLPWFCYGFATVLPWLCYGFAYGAAMVCPGFAMVLPTVLLRFGHG